MTDPLKTANSQDRILSVDFFRGFTMFMLVSSFGQLFSRNSHNPVVALLGRQLDHADWEGLTAWDLVQPFFMFIVGVAMPFSLSRKWAAGESWNHTFRSALRRSGLLLLLGWIIGSEEKSSFTNVLAQLSVTYLIAFLLMRKPLKWQLVFSFALLIFNDMLYRCWSVPGFDQPFTADHNFGSWFDIWLTGGLSEDRWVPFNAIPTAAHTIWGVAAGNVLLKDWPPQRKVRVLMVAGLIGIAAGYTLGLYIPIIKRVCTSSFILASGGWALLMLALSYLVIDVWKRRKGVLFFAIVGMNPLFIYLFWHAGGKRVMESLAGPILSRVFGLISPEAVRVSMVLAVSLMLWYICYFLYRKKIFIRI